MTGSPGTGKSFIALYLALTELRDSGRYDRIVLMRSVVPTREIGYLPGSIAEKTRVYELPYRSICSELYGRGDAYDILKTKGQLEFVVTSYIRGMTYDNCIMIIEEAQNMAYGEACSVITRLGDNTRLIVTGDYWQSDLNRFEKDGYLSFMKILENMSLIGTVHFDENDIVRGGLVKDFIKTKNRLKL